MSNRMNTRVVLNRKIMKRDRGIALLFALGIIAIILIITVIFASTALSDQKVSASQSHRAQARQIAQLAATRAMAQLLLTYAPESAVLTLGTTGTSDSEKNLDVDGLWRMDAYFARTGGTGYTAATEVTHVADWAKTRTKFPGWQYVTVDRGSGDEIHIGRYAFLAIGNSGGKVNVNGLANYDGESDADRAKHFGQILSELEFPAPGLGTPDVVSGITPATLKTQRSRYPWYSTDEFKVDFASSFSSHGRTQTIEDTFLFVAPSDPESFFAMGKHYHRFNLRRTDWDSVTVDILLGEAVELGDTLPDVHNGGGIPWLRNWNEAGGMKDVDSAKKQIAANIINYSRAATEPVVSNVKPADWPTTDVEVLYTGQKRRMMLNELAMKMELQGSASQGVEPGTGAVFYDLKLSVTSYFQSELIKMFPSATGDPASSDYSILLLGAISFTYNDVTANAEKTVNLNFQDGGNGLKLTLMDDSASQYPMYGIDKSSAGGDDRLMREFDVGRVDTDDEAVAKGNIKVKNLRIHLDRAVLQTNPGASNVDNVDFVNINKTYTYFDGALVSISDAAQVFSFNAKANDPRVNLDVTRNWTLPDGTTNGFFKDASLAASTVFNNMTVSNAPAIPNDVALADVEPLAVGGDASLDGTNPRISTAYIRHAPMMSLWEIGAISRAAPWQTIRLTKSPDVPDMLTGGGKSYAEGDGAILAQVKLTDKVLSSGKINLNVFYEGNTSCIRIDGYTNPVLFSYYSLFNSMPHTSKAADYDLETTTSLISADAATLADNLRIVSDFAGWQNRTELYQSPETAALDKLFNGTNDFMKEQTIGRTINLLKADRTYDEIYVAVIAQALRDVGAKSGTTPLRLPNRTIGDYSLGIKYPDGTAFISKAKAEDALRGRYDFGLDTVMATSKLLVTYVYDNKTKKWKAQKYVYVD